MQLSHITSIPFAMPLPAAPASLHSSRSIWVGRVLSGVVALMLTFDAGAKIARLKPVIEGTVQLGYPASTVLPIGLVLLACVIVYLIPRTAPLGAVLLTGYLGGAIATHVRVGNPLFTHILAPIYVAALLWSGLYLRDARVRAAIGSLR